METKSTDRLIYRHKDFEILMRKGHRDYRWRQYKDPNIGEFINSQDLVFTIKTNGREYQYTSDDVGRMAYFIIANKWIDSAAKTEARIIKRYIEEALWEVKEKIKPRLEGL